MHDNAPAYGLWTLVILNSAIFIIFAFSFGKPQSPRDWRSFGAFSAFIVALFTEMYGFPLTIYLLAGWLQTRYPGTDLMSHNAGHLWWTLFGFNGDPHLSFLHLLSTAVIVAGFLVLGNAWRVLYAAQREGRLATTGTVYLRSTPAVCGLHRDHVRLSLAVADLLTLLMFPFLVAMYVHLGRTEEREAVHRFGAEYQHYASVTPGWIPGLGAPPRQDRQMRKANLQE